MKQLLLVAVVAAVFGTGFGYLGANFQTSWVTGVAQAATPGQTTGSQAVREPEGPLKDRVARLERELGNNPQRVQWRFHESAYKRIDRLERNVGGSWSLEDRIRTLERNHDGLRR